jgi:hypothetical protein
MFSPPLLNERLCLVSCFLPMTVILLVCPWFYWSNDVYSAVSTTYHLLLQTWWCLVARSEQWSSLSGRWHSQRSGGTLVWAECGCWPGYQFLDRRPAILCHCLREDFCCKWRWCLQSIGFAAAVFCYDLYTSSNTVIIDANKCPAGMHVCVDNDDWPLVCLYLNSPYMVASIRYQTHDTWSLGTRSPRSHPHILAHLWTSQGGSDYGVITDVIPGL